MCGRGGEGKELVFCPHEGLRWLRFGSFVLLFQTLKKETVSITSSKRQQASWQNGELRKYSVQLCAKDLKTAI